MNTPDELFRACETHDNVLLKKFNYGTITTATIITALNVAISSSNIAGTATILSEIVFRRLSISLLPSLTSAIKTSKKLPDTGKRLVQLHLNAFEALGTISELQNYITTCDAHSLLCLFDSALVSNSDICKHIADRSEFYTHQSKWFEKFCNSTGLQGPLIRHIASHPKFNPNSPTGDFSPICLAARTHNYPLVEALLNNPLIDLIDNGPYLVRQTDDPYILNLLLRHGSFVVNNVLPLAVCNSKKMPESAKIALYENNPCLDPSIDNCYVLGRAIVAGHTQFARFLIHDVRCALFLQKYFDRCISTKNENSAIVKIIDYLLPRIWITEEHVQACRSIEVLMAMLHKLKFDERELQPWINCLGESLSELGKQYNMNPVDFIKRLLQIDSTIYFKMHEEDWNNKELAMFYINKWPYLINFDGPNNALTIAAQCGSIDLFVRLMEMNVDPSMFSNAALVAALSGQTYENRENKNKIINMLLTDVRVLLMGIIRGQVTNKQYQKLTRRMDSLLTPILIAEKCAKVRHFYNELVARSSQGGS